MDTIKTLYHSSAAPSLAQNLGIPSIRKPGICLLPGLAAVVIGLSAMERSVWHGKGFLVSIRQRRDDPGERRCPQLAVSESTTGE